MRYSKPAIIQSLVLCALSFVVSFVTMADQWVTLGTSGGPSVQTHRSQIANALVVNDAVYLFDVGNGVQRQLALAGLQERQVKAVFLSHHHLDHNADLGPVIVTHWTFYPGILNIFGPEGTAQLSNGLATANAPTILAAYPTGGPAKDPLASTFDAKDIEAGYESPVVVYKDENIIVSALGADHYQSNPSIELTSLPKALSYRIQTAERTIVYTGDTGPSEAMIKLATDADLLVTEMVNLTAITDQLNKFMGDGKESVKQGIIAGMRINHLTGEVIADIANKAKVKEIVVTHFVPSPEVTDSPEDFANALTSRFSGKVSLANDLDRF